MFPANVVTRAQKRRVGNDITLNDSFMLPLFAEESSSSELQCSNVVKPDQMVEVVTDLEVLNVPITRERMVASQRDDPSLTKLRRQKS